MFPSGHGHRWRAEVWTGLWALLLCLGLEARFPLFFLNDDNLNGSLPLWVEMGRNLLSWQNPFVSQCLMGGGYPLYADATFVGGSLHPWMLVCGAICNVAPAWLVVELVACPFLMLAAVSFCWMGRRLAERFGFEIPEKRLIFLALAYAFCGCNLVLGANWSIFLAWPSALCIAIGALVLPSRKAAVLGLSLAFIHGFLGAHPQATAYALLAVAGWAVFLRLHTRRMESYLRVLLAGLVSLLVLSPLLLPALATFSDSFRGAKEVLQTYTAGSLLTPSPLFLLQSLLVGPHGPAEGRYQIWQMTTSTWQTIPMVASVWTVLLCTFGYRRLRPGRPLVGFACAGLLLAFFLTAQTALIQEMLASIPFMRSFRWPIRQCFLIVFFLNLIALPLAKWANRGAFWGTALAGSLLLGLAFAWNGVPYFNYGPRSSERHMVVSGEGRRVWNAIRRDLSPDALIIPVETIENVQAKTWRGFGWIGGFNYPCLFEVRSASGYSVTKPRQLDFTGRSPYGHTGVLLLPADLERAQASFPRLHRVSYAPGAQDALLVTDPDGATRRYPFELPPMGVRDVPTP